MNERYAAIATATATATKRSHGDAPGGLVAPIVPRVTVARRQGVRGAAAEEGELGDGGDGGGDGGGRDARGTAVVVVEGRRKGEIVAAAGETGKVLGAGASEGVAANALAHELGP